MVISTDIEYIATKNIKNSDIYLVAPFDELADWISKNYNVIVLNVIYDKIIPDLEPRLQVILEFDKDEYKFHDKNCSMNFDKSKQLEIKNKFIEIIKRDKSLQFEYERLIVVFSSFEHIAIEEANYKITTEDLDNLKKTFKNLNIWKIRPAFGSATIFFFTDTQLSDNKNKQILFNEKYFEVLKKYDEFNYININNFNINLDSKENFDDNYQGSWFYYDR